MTALTAIYVIERMNLNMSEIKVKFTGLAKSIKGTCSHLKEGEFFVNF